MPIGNNPLSLQPTISMIAAMSKNRVIGRHQDLPWHLPADMAYFKRMTKGKPIIMGRKTYDSLGAPLPNRLNIVISRNTTEIEGCEVVDSLEEALAIAEETSAEEIMIIGGGQIYEAAMSVADRIYITIIDMVAEGDTYFPAWPENEWIEVDVKAYEADEKNPYDYRFVTLEKVL